MSMHQTESASWPVPLPDNDSEKYWSAAKQGALLVQRCTSCGQAQFYFRALCHHCKSSDLSTELSAGLGTVATFSIVYRPPLSCFKRDVPYVVALVDLNEGVRFLTNVIHCDPVSVYIGQKVRVVFERIEGSEQMLPKMEPA
jgi:uncharacterized OB-fold protein